MKNISLLFILIISILFYSCRKKELDNVLQYRDYTPKIEHCFNNYIDADEQGLDCGGECKPCEQSYAPCSLNIDTVFFENLAFTSRHIIQKTSSNTVYYFRFEDYGFIRFSFNSTPNLTTIYEGAYSVYEEEDVKIDYQYSQWDPQYKGFGRVYVTYQNGSYFISACNLGVANSNGNILYTISFKLIVE